MRILNLILAGTLALAPMAPIPALAQPKAATAPGSQGEMLSLLREITGWLEPTTAVLTETQEVWLFVLEGVDRATNDDVTGASGRTWAEGWLKQADARLIALKANSAALQPMPSELAGRYGRLAPAAARQVNGFQKMRTMAQTGVAELDGFFAELRPLILSAAGGDDPARLLLITEGIAGYRLALKADNRLLELSIATASPATHPQAVLARSILESNAAMDLPFALIQSMLDADMEEMDPVATGKAMKAHIARSRAAAKDIWPSAQKTSAAAMAQVSEGPLVQAVSKAMATYEESGAVELKINDLLDLMADDLLRGDDFDMESWPFDQLETLATRRGTLQEQRVRYISGP